MRELRPLSPRYRPTKHAPHAEYTDFETNRHLLNRNADAPPQRREPRQKPAYESSQSGVALPFPQHRGDGPPGDPVNATSASRDGLDDVRDESSSDGEIESRWSASDKR